MDKRIDTLFEAIKEQTHLNEPPFNEGLDSATIAAAEREVGHSLPDDYRVFLLRANGQSEGAQLMFPPGQLTLLDLQGALRLWRELLPYESEEFAGEHEDEGRVLAVGYHRGRFPIAYYEVGTQYLFLDYLPGPQGKEGQIIFNPDEASFFAIANSFSDLLDTYIDSLTSRLAKIEARSPEFGGGFWFVTQEGAPIDYQAFIAIRKALRSV